MIESECDYHGNDDDYCMIVMLLQKVQCIWVSCEKQSSSYCLMSLVRLQGKFDMDHSWEWEIWMPSNADNIDISLFSSKKDWSDHVSYRDRRPICRSIMSVNASADTTTECRPTVEWCNNWYSIKCQSRSRADTQSICGWTSISADMPTDTSTNYWLTCWSSVSHGSIECQSIYQSTQWVTYYWPRVPTRYMIQMVSSNEAASPGSSSGKQLDLWPKTWE